MKRKPVSAHAELELDEQAVIAHLPEYLQHVPRAAKPLGIRIEDGRANPEDLIQNAKERLFVKLSLPE